ncbi:MAG: gliding motility protein GldN [Bacteroidetes bacterium]|nr:MAG: gliding motility protein GldN [Bacteroidota bacterium]
MKGILKLGLLCVAVLIGVGAQAQPKRKAPPKKVNTKKSVPKAKVETPPVVVAPPVVEKDTIALAAPEKTRRATTSVQGDLVRDKTPLAYDHIRIDDQVYKQIVWRELNVRERINLPFVYEATEDNGSQKFFNILLRHIKDGDVTAFSGVNDRFTTPLEVDAIATMLAGKKTVQRIPDVANDPTLSLGLMKDTTIRNDFDDRTITSYRLKEEWIFDRETSRLVVRILGIAPVKSIYNEDGSFRDSYALFWLFYPDLRPYLAKYEAYNPRNMGARMSWEEIFETRYFGSFIYKSTINNPFDKPLAGYINDPLMRLLEGDNIKEEIFNWEQDQWSY